MNILERRSTMLAYYDDIAGMVKKGTKVPVVYGCVDQQKPHFIGAFAEQNKRILVISHTELKARELCESLNNAVYYPAKDFIFYSADICGSQMSGERLRVIDRILSDDRLVVVTTVDGCLDRLMAPDVYRKYTMNFNVGDELDLELVAENLVFMGYDRCAQVESPGQFALRGGILDIYSFTFENPYRIELWDTEIDSIRTFDAESQRSVDNLQSVSIFPATELIVQDNLSDGFARLEKDAKDFEKKLKAEGHLSEAMAVRNNLEALKDRLFVVKDYTGCESYVNYLAGETVSFIDYFDRDDTLIVLDEPNRIDEKIRVVTDEFRDSMSHRLQKGQILPGQADALYTAGDVYAKISSRRAMTVSTMDCKAAMLNVGGHFNIDSRGIGSYNNSFESLVNDIRGFKKRKYCILLVSASRTRAKRLAEDLRDNDVTAIYSEDDQRDLVEGEVMTTFGKLTKGYEYPGARFVVIAENDIFGTARREKRRKKIYSGKAISDFAELSIGDYVVHESHGLGIYRGIVKLEVEKIEKDYIKIEYAGGGNLYILATQLDVIQKYADSEAKKPKLNKLGTAEWERTKTRVRGAVKDVADELLRLYAIRQSKEGFCFSPDTPWQREFEELFPYEETEDQLNAIADTKKDMESRRIMDRLICGDVGFGKTEIALRAAFKAVADGKQVAYLVPTTILAKQHYASFDQRMKDFGVNVRMLSRFCTPKEIKDTIDGLKKGLVDVVVGTHRILSKDVVFKDLGLLIVDEEQRFGVSHKEKIKQLKETVDVITLTATPIPRTLHMSLIGIRDMSILEEPPIDRLPIQTFVTEYDEEMVREAINRELSRGGQVYYVYNRVQGIEEVSAAIRRLVPDANVAFAHGQMHERELEQIMVDFVNGEIDVLVSTTIIETGLDIPNVNTIIIHDSDRFGLSQLYQLRGRVGRSGRVAYAFLMYRRDKLLKEVAEKRLSAIKEFTELGSGFKIAMKDLEIRGAGNLLGEEQHGHMAAVGYDLYCKMLNEEIDKLKGVSVNLDFETLVDIDVDAYVPATYIRSEKQKLDVYKRIATISNSDELSDMTDELTDRFGDIPKTAYNLMRIALLKSNAHQSYITEIKSNRRDMKLRMLGSADIDVAGIVELVKKMEGRLRFTNGENPYFTYSFGKDDIKNTDTYIARIEDIVERIHSLCAGSEGA